VVSTVESLEQLPGTFDFDFLLAPTTSSTSSHTAPTSPGQTDLPLDFSSHDFDHSLDLAPQHWLPEQIDLATVVVGENTEDMLQHPPPGGSSAASASLLSTHSASLDMVSLEMDRFAASTTSTLFDNSNTTTTSPVSMTSLPYSRDRPLLAPKQTTTPPSSLSASPPVSLIDTAPTAKRAAGKKRSRAESATGVDSSNNSVQDSEDERVVEKRRRNTMAARRFRKRKLDHVSDLESKLAKVTEERDELRLQIAKWEGEVMALRKLMERKET
jgi:hypothetical protein